MPRLSGLPATAAWLGQFERSDREVATHLVDSLNLVSATAFHESLTSLMESLLAQEGPCAFYAVREIAKDGCYFPQKGTKPMVVAASTIGSEGLVAQVITKLAQASASKALDHPPIKTLRRKRIRNLVLVDDIAVSGKRAATFAAAFMRESSLRSWASYGKLDIHFIAYSATDWAAQRLASQFHRWTRIQRDGRLHLHVAHASVAGYTTFAEPLLTQAQALCSKYPPTLRRPDAGARMGFGRALAATVFQHGCPNNVPAMFWAIARDWKPLFPGRQVPHRLLSAFRDTRTSRLAKALSEDPAAGADRADLVRVLRALQRRRLIDEELVHATGIATLNARLVLEECVRFGLVSAANGRTTAAGRAELRRLEKVAPPEVRLVTDDQPVYIPSSLRGSRDRI